MRKAAPSIKASKHIWTGILLLVFLIGAVGGWLFFAKLQGAVIAPGFVALSRNTVHVSHLDGGEVSELLVEMGAVVKLGDELVRLDQGRLQVDLLEKELVFVKAVSSRLTAEVYSKDRVVFPDDLIAEAANKVDLKELLQEQRETFKIGLESHRVSIARLRNEQESIEQQKQNYVLQRSLLEEQKALIEKGQERLSSLKGQGYATERQKEEEENRLLSVKQNLASADFRINEVTIRQSEIDFEIRELQENRRRLASGDLEERKLQMLSLEKSLRLERERARSSIIRAPEDGVIVVMVPLAKGRVIAPGEVIASILPADGRFLIEGRVRPQDRDQITVGQRSELRVAAAYRSDTPTFDGEIEGISADRLVDDATGEVYFRVLVGALQQREFSSSFQNNNWAVKMIRIPAGWIGLEIAQPTIVKEKSVPFDLRPGMTVDIFIQTKSRRAINYFIKPLTDALSKAFK